MVEHIVDVDDENWREFGPGAVGMGWDSMLLGLAIHLATGEAIDPSFGQRWIVYRGRSSLPDAVRRGVVRRERRQRGGSRNDACADRSMHQGVPRRGVKLEHVLASAGPPEIFSTRCIDQTPVQIAWVTRDLDATEKALTTLLGAKKWIRMPGVHFGPDTCTYRGRPADFVADISLSYAGDTQLELIAPVTGDSIYTEFLRPRRTRPAPHLHRGRRRRARAGASATPRWCSAGVMPGGMEFAYVSAEAAGVPYIEIAHIPPEIRAFFDYVKQEQQ